MKLPCKNVPLIYCIYGICDACTYCHKTNLTPPEPQTQRVATA